METPETYEEAKARRRQRTIVLLIAAAALCCVCVVVAIAIYSWSAARGGAGDLDTAPEGSTPTGPQNSLTPSLESNSVVVTPGTEVDPGEAPTGGLGNDILRNDTWRAVAAAAEGQGCDQPVGADSTIEVLQEPDAAGVWVEQWTVACESGDSFTYEVEYTLDATGATYDIRPVP